MVTEETLNKLFACGLPKGITKSQVKSKSISLTNEQKDKLMDNAPRGTNKRIVYDIAAWHLTYKKMPFCVAVKWLQWKGTGAGCYYTLEQFKSLVC